MNKKLFRQQAIMASAGSRFGNPMFYQPLPVRLLVFGVLLIFVVFIVFAALAEIKQTERVRGYLTPATGELKLYSHRAGIFQKIHSREGQLVQAGEVLATISSTQFDESGQQQSQVLLRHLKQQIEQMKKRVLLLSSESAVNGERLLGRIAGIEAELLLLREERDVVLQRLALNEQELLSSQILLDRGAIGAREHNQVKANWFSLLQLSKTAEIGIQSKLLALQDAQHQLDIQPLQHEDELLMLQTGLSQLQSRLSELRAQELFTVTAPRAGIISNLLASAGDYADPRIPLMTLVPDDYVLEARLYLPSRTLGKVEPGQEILLAYDAYPYQTYGTFTAYITQISVTVMDPREFLFPIELSEPVYLVKARIAEQSIDADAMRKLRPGLQFSAEIVTGSESILRRLSGPLTGLSRRL